MAYKPRLTAPTTSDKHWISTSKGGYNRCIVIDSKTGSVLPNCVGYHVGDSCIDGNVWEPGVYGWTESVAR